MANLFQPSLVRATDGNGNPASGAKMWLYLTGTITGGAYYTDQAGVVYGANPQVANSAGMFAPIYLDPALTYRVVCKTGDLAETIFDVDPVRGYDEGAIQSAATAAAASAASAAAASVTAAANAETVAADMATTQGYRDEAADHVADAAAQVALANAAALTAGAYPATARSYVPRGATGVGTITGGSGGTDGTFALAFTGGNFGANPSGTFTVASGAVTAITITGPGVYIGASLSAPTLDFSASTGLTGASAALTIDYLVTAGRYYWAQSADGQYNELYQNVAGNATATSPLVRTISEATVDAARVAAVTVAKYNGTVWAQPVAIGGRMVQPTELSFDLRVRAGIYVDNGSPYTPLSGSANASYAFDTYTAAPAALPTKIGLHGYGQSNSNGSGQADFITTTAKYAGQVLTFNGGPKADAGNAGTTMTSTKNLVEDGVSAWNQVGYATQAGETIMSGAAYGFYDRSIRTLGSVPQVFAHTAGVGGSGIGPLSTTGSGNWYDRIVTSVDRAQIRMGGDYAVAAFLFDQGEADQGIISQASYQASLRAIKNQLVATAIAETGQAFDPIMVVDQKNWGAFPTATTPAGGTNTYPASVTLAQVAEQGDGIFIAFPDYCCPVRTSIDDKIHRTTVGHKLAGLYYGRVVHKVMAERKEWRPCQMLHAWVEGGAIYVRCYAPYGSLRIDESRGVVTQHGFRVEDNTGSVSLTVSIESADLIKLTLGRALDAGASVRYGLDYTTADHTEIPGGSIADSEPESAVISGQTWTMPNFLLAGSLIPTTLEA